MRRRWLAVAGLALWLGDSAGAHEFDPGYLSLTESAAGEFEVQWKVSIAGGLYAALVPRLPAECELDPQVRTYVVLDAQIQNSGLSCADGLANLTIRPAGIISIQININVLTPETIT